jgi:hypothetical protein
MGFLKASLSPRVPLLRLFLTPRTSGRIHRQPGEMFPTGGWGRAHGRHQRSSIYRQLRWPVRARHRQRPRGIQHVTTEPQAHVRTRQPARRYVYLVLSLVWRTPY